MAVETATAKPKFCSECGTRLREDARFCHGCGATIDGQPRAVAAPRKQAEAQAEAEAEASAILRWGMPLFALVALIVLSIWSAGSRSRGSSDAPQQNVPLAAATATGAAPDISSMSPEERADRLFNRVMRLSTEGKTDSVAFFASMAYGALESLQPLDAHKRYDMGLVALVAGDAPRARAQADTILAQRPTHLLGLSLAARAADLRGDANAARGIRRRLLAAEAPEKAAALPEYTDHEADVRTALDAARKG
jgi:zinc-ribbon domain